MTTFAFSTGARVAAAVLGVGLTFGAAPANAQVAPISPRVQSFAGAASDAIACGAEALAANPAGLARWCQGPSRLVFLPTFKLTVWSGAAGQLLWDNRSAFLEPGTLHSQLDPAVRQEILAAIPSEGLYHRERLDVALGQVTGRRMSGSLTFTTSSRGRISRDLAELLLEGYDGSRINYSIGDSRQDVESYLTLALGHGRTVYGVDVGVTGHVMLGMGMTSWQAFDPAVDIEARSVRAELLGLFAGNRLLEGDVFSLGKPDGLGVGLDVGAMREYGPYRVGAAIQNLVRWSSWSDELFAGRYQIVATEDEVTTDYETSLWNSTTAPARERPIEARLLEDAHFPRRLRLAAGWEGSRASVGAGLVVAGEGRLDRDWSELVSVGAELRPLEFFQIQAGAAVTTDGLHQVSGGAGLRFGWFNIDAALSRLSGEEGSGGGYTIGFGFSLTET